MMKLPLIFAAASVLVACQVQALFDPDGGDDGGFYVPSIRRVLPHVRRPEEVQEHVGSQTRRTGVGLLIIDKIFHMIKKIADTIASVLKKLKEAVDKIGYTNLSELMTSVIQSLHKFSKNVGTPGISQRGERDNQPNLIQCQLYDTRPECQNDRTGQ